MSQELYRRTFLATAAAIGAAGCTYPGYQQPGKVDDKITPEPSDTQQSGATEFLYEGSTIPPIQHPGSRTPPTVAGPHPDVDNPILTAEDVTDFGVVTFVADPFLFIEEDEWHLFFEVYNENRTDPDATIGYAHSHDGTEWEYQGIVLEKEVHTSFPFIWKWENEYYMCPPSRKNVELWRATDFPHDWELLGHPIDVDFYPHDPVFFRYDDRWWLVTDRNYTDVMVYHSDNLESESWTPHSGNPVVADRFGAARPGGRPVVIGKTPYLFFMDLTHEYGDKIRAYEVVELSTETYEDREVPNSPVLAESGTGWNAEAMHTFDPWWVGDGWVSAVDGEVDDIWSIGLFYTPAEIAPDTDRVPYDLPLTEGYYTFGTHEAITVDHSGNGRPGSIYGAEPETRSGLDGLQYEDDNGRVVFACPYTEPFVTDEFTVVTYAKPGATARPQTLFEYATVEQDRYFAVQRTGEGQWRVSATGEDGAVSYETDAPPTTEATQIALSAGSDGELRLFVGSERQAVVDDPGPYAGPYGYLILGSDRTGNTPWRGWTGPTGVFSASLSERELAEIDSQIRGMRHGTRLAGLPASAERPLSPTIYENNH